MENEGMERTEWLLVDQPMGWLAYLSPLPLVAVLAFDLLRTPPTMVRFWMVVGALVLLIAVGWWLARRLRVLLTTDGAEVRRLRTMVYRWSDIASVQSAPAPANRYAEHRV